jgi:hypothetical protein
MSSYPRALSHLALAVLIAGAINGCSSDDDLSTISTCGNGSVEGSEECDDGGTCVGGSNDGGRCSIVLGEEDTCPDFAGSCSLTATCNGGDLDGELCSADSECCPDDTSDCGATCFGRGGICSGGDLDAAACGFDTDCCPPENGASCGICLGSCLGGPSNGASCNSDASCSSVGTCVASDTDSCTSICTLPRCGDGVVNVGLEQCDGFNLAGATCADLLLGNGRLECDESCLFDTSECGPPFTPTNTPLPPTATPTPTNTLDPSITPDTPTPTATPIATATPTMGSCGNFLLDANEYTVVDVEIFGQSQMVEIGNLEGLECLEDGIPAACTASSETITVSYELVQPLGFAVDTFQGLISYRTDLVSFPTSGILPPSIINERFIIPDPPPSALSGTGLIVATRAVIGRSEPFADGIAFSIVFDICEGAPTPTINDFDCFVESCAGSGTPNQNCGCFIVIE